MCICMLVHISTILLQDETSGAPHDYHGHSRCFRKAVLMSRLLVRLCSPGEQGPVHSAVVRRAARQRQQQWRFELVSSRTAQLPAVSVQPSSHIQVLVEPTAFLFFCFCYRVFSRASQVHSQRSQQPQSPGHARACNP